MDEKISRVQKIRKKFPVWDVDAVLISSATNRRWLSQFTGSYGRLLITNDRALIATDSRYWQQVIAQSKDFELFKDLRRPKDTAALLGSVAAKRIGFEANHVSVSDMAMLENAGSKKWVPLEKTVEPFRQVKTNEEIETIRKAAAITDQTMALVPGLVMAGMSERELAWELEKTMRENGADAMAFPIIVAFGPNSALPHHNPSHRELRTGDIVLVDMGAEINGFKSDLTRTFFFGNIMSEQFLTIFDLVHLALITAVNNIKPGLDTIEAHNLAMDVISDGGYREYFGHGLGHGLGLDIHEDPFLSSTREAEMIDAGMAITVEPGIYLPGWGGIRIEDLVLVTETGIEAISKCPKTPQIRL